MLCERSVPAPSSPTASATGASTSPCYAPPVPHPDLADEHLIDEHLVAVIPATHPLTRRNTIKLHDLEHETFIVAPRPVAPYAHDAVLTLCHQAFGHGPHALQEAADTASTLILVAAGAGIALLPHHAPRHHRGTKTTTLDIDDRLPALTLHTA